MFTKVFWPLDGWSTRNELKVSESSFSLTGFSQIKVLRLDIIVKAVCHTGYQKKLQQHISTVLSSTPIYLYDKKESSKKVPYIIRVHVMKGLDYLPIIANNRCI